MSNFFEFESEFVDSLKCIPMIVRLKLDTCGVKLKLNHWHKFNDNEKQLLVEMPCLNIEESLKYKNYLQNLIKEKTGEYAKELEIESNPDWTNKSKIPDQVVEKALEYELNLGLNQWQNLTELQRFALIKLSKSGHENNNFLPALKEFNLI